MGLFSSKKWKYKCTTRLNPSEIPDGYCGKRWGEKEKDPGNNLDFIPKKCPDCRDEEDSSASSSGSSTSVGIGMSRRGSSNSSSSSSSERPTIDATEFNSNWMILEGDYIDFNLIGLNEALWIYQKGLDLQVNLKLSPQPWQRIVRVALAGTKCTSQSLSTGIDSSTRLVGISSCNFWFFRLSPQWGHVRLPFTRFSLSSLPSPNIIIPIFLMKNNLLMV